jgi:hypothetical protein
MKKALLTLAAVAMASSAFAQGTITFYNNNIVNPATGATYVAGIWADNGDGISGNSTVGGGTIAGGVTVGLFLASDLNTPLATTTLRTASRQEVFAGTQDVTLTGTTPNSPANLVIRAWSTAAGSFANAQVTQGMEWGEQAFTSKPLGGINPTPPPPSYTAPDIAPFTGFELTTTVPEPSTIALSVLGIGALALARRRK